MRAILNLGDVKNAVNTFRPLFVSGSKQLQRLRINLNCGDNASLVLQSFSPEGIVLERNISIVDAPDPEHELSAGEVYLSYFPLVEILNILKDDNIVVEKIETDSQNLFYVRHSKGSFAVPVYSGDRMDFEMSHDIDYDNCILVELPAGVLQANLNHVRDIINYYGGKKGGNVAKYAFLEIKENKVKTFYLSSFALSLAETDCSEFLVNSEDDFCIPLIYKVIECILLWDTSEPVSIYLDSMAGRAVFISGKNRLNYMFPKTKKPDIGSVINREKYETNIETTANSIISVMKRVSVVSKRGEVNILINSADEIVLQSLDKHSNSKEELVASESIQATVNNYDSCPKNITSVSVDHSILSVLLNSISSEEIVLEYCSDKPVMIIRTKNNNVTKAVGFRENE